MPRCPEPPSASGHCGFYVYPDPVDALQLPNREEYYAAFDVFGAVEWWGHAHEHGEAQSPGITVLRVQHAAVRACVHLKSFPERDGIFQEDAIQERWLNSVWASIDRPASVAELVGRWARPSDARRLPVIHPCALAMPAPLPMPTPTTPETLHGDELSCGHVWWRPGPHGPKVGQRVPCGACWARRRVTKVDSVFFPTT
jgi:hypothetical protein